MVWLLLVFTVGMLTGAGLFRAGILVGSRLSKKVAYAEGIQAATRYLMM